MKQNLLPPSGQFYKANLHCHTTISDGKWTPEQVREEYAKRGYQVVAFTDHDVMIPHPELRREDFLPLTGFEVEINQAGGRHKCCHICFVALEEGTVVQPMWHRTKYLFANAPKYRDQVCTDPEEPDFEREFTPECISRMMKTGREKGFFVTYNHPAWSMEDFSDYSRYEGMHAMEMMNYGCLIYGYDEYNSRVYDDMLREGKRIYCIDTDDNHNDREDSFGGFTMIKAQSLSYRDITKALEAGHFYASMGPEIHSLSYEDGRVRITCSPAASVSMVTGVRHADIALPKNGEPVTEAEFRVPKNCGYFRLTVTDDQGKKADTNAYFLDQLEES